MKTTISATIDSDLKKELDDKEINISKLANKLMKQHLADKITKKLDTQIKEHAEAVEADNRLDEKIKASFLKEYNREPTPEEAKEWRESVNRIKRKLGDIQIKDGETGRGRLEENN